MSFTGLSLSRSKVRSLSNTSRMHIQFSVPHRCSEKDAQLGLCEHSNEAVPAAPGKPPVADYFEKEDLRNINLN